MKTQINGEPYEPHSKEEGELLGKLMVDKSITAPEVAKASGLSASTVAYLVSGKAKIRNVEKWKKTMNFLQTSPSIPSLAAVRDEVRKDRKNFDGYDLEYARKLGVHGGSYYALLRGRSLSLELRRRIYLNLLKSRGEGFSSANGAASTKARRTNSMTEKTVIEQFVPSKNGVSAAVEMAIECRHFKKKLDTFSPEDQKALLKLLSD